MEEDCIGREGPQWSVALEKKKKYGNMLTDTSYLLTILHQKVN
jgi:hypothetical protein